MTKDERRTLACPLSRTHGQGEFSFCKIRAHQCTSWSNYLLWKPSQLLLSPKRLRAAPPLSRRPSGPSSSAAPLSPLAFSGTSRGIGLLAATRFGRPRTWRFTSAAFLAASPVARWCCARRSLHLTLRRTPQSAFGVFGGPSARG